MPDKSPHPRLSFLAGLILILALGAGALGGILRTLGTNDFMLEKWLDWEAAPELAEADRAPVAGLIADTMAGRTEVFQYKGLFSEQARVHMADCVPLFRLARTVGLVGFGIAFAALGLCFVFRSLRHIGLGLLAGTGILLLAALALGVWGLIDFDGLFTLFHRTFFANDLWLFPPDDLLIRLMPLPFFVRCAALGLGLWASVPVCAAMVGGLFVRKERRHD